MAINKKLIHFKKYETFNGSQGINGATEPTNGMYGNIPEHSIVFILDAKKIWTHGQLYDCDLSALEEIGLIKELIELIQDTLKKEDPYWEYYLYEYVPLTIEALGDGTIEFLPRMSANFIKGSLDGGKTWVNITNNPIQLVSGDKLLLKGSVAGAYDPNAVKDVNCGNLITQFPYNAFGNPSKLLKGNYVEDDVNDDIDYEYIFSALLAVLAAQNGLVMHKLLEQLIEGFETLSFKEKVIVILNNIAGLNPTEEELLQFVSSLLQQYGTVSFLEAVSTICNTLQPQFPDLTVDEDFLLTVFKEEFGEDVTLHDIVAMLYQMIIGVPDDGELRECLSSTFYNFLKNNIVSAENLYLDEYTRLILLGSRTLQIAPKVMDLGHYPPNTNFISTFEGCAALVKAPELPATKLSEHCYERMFYGCTSLTEAPKLPATELSAECYNNMFRFCESLIEAPKLPATTLAYRCYYSMFEDCISLTSTPELPATVLAEGCYHGMFLSCVKLKNADIVLPAPILLEDCYAAMFYSCSSLTLPPKLPATTLSNSCYSSMFTGCASLVAAPELPATTLVDYCYLDMFDYCSKLSYIKMLAKNIQATNCLKDFIAKAPAEGTFVKAKGVDIPTGDNGIPEGWTVEEYVSPEDQLNELLVSVDAKADKSELENYLPKSGGSLTGDLTIGNVHLYEGDETWNGGIDLVNGTIEASEVNDFSYVQDSQGNNLLEILDTKAEIYTITDFSAYDVDNIAKGTYTLQINPSPLESAIRNNKVILIQHELGMEASPVLDAYIEDLIYLTVMYDSCIYLVFIELDLTTLTSSSIECIYNKYDLLVTKITVDNKLNIKDALTITKDENDNALMQISENLYFDNYVGWNSGDGVQHYINAFGDAYLTDLRTNKLEIDNALTITKDNSDYAHLNISEGLTIDNLVEWTDGSDTTASINYDGSASFTNLSVAGKNVTSFLTHYNSDINVVRSLTNIPTDKAVVFAHINSSQELTFDDANLVSGRGVHVFIYNYLTKAITVILPSGVGIYECDNITEFEISPGSIAEVNMIYLSSWESGHLKFIRSITV